MREYDRLGPPQFCCRDGTRIRRTRGVDLSVWPPRYEGTYAPAPDDPYWLPEIECAPPAVRDVLFEVLSDAGYRTITATTPTEAQRLAERLDGRIDLVLTELDERRAAALAESLGAGQALTLQKPYSPDALATALEALLADTVPQSNGPATAG